MRFSRRTLAALARALSHLISHSEISNLGYELGVEAPGLNKLDRCTNLIKNLESLTLRTGTANDEVILELLQRYVASVDETVMPHINGIPGLLAVLKVEGYEIMGHRIIPTTPEPAALAPQISALEAALVNRSLAVAARHYGQACDNLTVGNFEAANGQIRSYLENLFITLAQQASGTSFSDASAALQHMKDKGFLEAAEWNTLRGFWDLCQSRGPHHGLSDPDEAVFRLHMATSIGRYILVRISQSTKYKG